MSNDISAEPQVKQRSIRYEHLTLRYDVVNEILLVTDADGGEFEFCKEEVVELRAGFLALGLDSRPSSVISYRSSTEHVGGH